MTQLLTDILEQALGGQDLSPEQGLFLLQQSDRPSLEAIRAAADQLRRQQVGETVTYVVNRNVNFTNICEQHCSFCAFRRDANQPGAYWLTPSQIHQKIEDALIRGATEICMQGGLNPQAKRQGSSLSFYQDLIAAIKRQAPQLHLHAFSPQEIQFIAREDDLSCEYAMRSLQAAGLGSMPGTAAEVLDDSVRRVICPEKLDSQTWKTIINLAHRLGIPTTSTMLCGQIETPAQQIAHLQQLRSLQQTAQQENTPARISEFILLPFVGAQAPAPLRRRVGRDQPDLQATLQLTAVSRLFLGPWIVNHQPSWVKLGLTGALEALRWGCNDLGGTLMEEHITTMAGAKGGTNLTVSALQQGIHSLGRPYQERTTLYQPRRPAVDPSSSVSLSNERSRPKYHALQSRTPHPNRVKLNMHSSKG